MLYITTTMKNVNSLDAYLVRKNVDFQKLKHKISLNFMTTFHNFALKIVGFALKTSCTKMAVKPMP